MNHSSSPADGSDSSHSLLDQMAAAYASCHSYLDEGEVVTVFISQNERRISTLPFSTAFVRPSHFRFEFLNRYREDLPWNRYIVWQSGELVRTWWAVQPGIKEASDLAMAIAGATGLSYGAASKIPNLLMPDLVPCHGLMYFTQCTLLDQEQVQGTLAHKFQTTGPPYQRRNGMMDQRNKTFWIDAQTSLVLQIFDRMQFDGFYTETTTTYRPQMNVTVPPDRLDFDAPV